jgi:asparagine synthase (glutamine-hydrolysing)
MAPFAGSFRPAAGPPDLVGSGAASPITCRFEGRLDDSVELAAQLGREHRLGEPVEPLLAAAFRRWGEGLPERLRGDFALFCWDGERRCGLLARDRLGAGSLYLCEDGDGALLFATEVGPLLALLRRRPDPDPVGVAHWIVAGIRPGDGTLFAGIERPAPGTALMLSQRGWTRRRYWAPRFRPGPGGEVGVSALRQALTRSVERRTATGRAAVLMSGGLDSAAVSALAVATGRQPIACSATFPDHPAADEESLIRELRESLDLAGPTAEVRAGGLVAAAIDHVAVWQVPQLGWGDFWAKPLIAAAAACGATTLLDGDGGDEVFATRSFLMADRLRRGRPAASLRLAAALPGAGPHVPRRDVLGTWRSFGLVGALPRGIGGALARRRLGGELPAWLLPPTRRALLEADDSEQWKRLDGPRWWAHAADACLVGIEATGVYEHQRRRAARHGLAAAHPLLDSDLVELALSLPPEASFDTRYNRPMLRRALAGTVPDAIRLRPAKAWFQSLIVDSLTGPDWPAVRALLTSPEAEIGAYVDRRRMTSELLSGEPWRRVPFLWMQTVWRLVTIECWLRAQSRSPSEIVASLPTLGPARADVASGHDSYLFSP